MLTVLFVSAPFGPAFWAIAQALEARGCRVLRTVRNGGEVVTTPRQNRIVFSDPVATWGTFLKNLILSEQVTTVVAFNDTAPTNRTALNVAAELGRDTWVLENGYLRPHWVTLDRSGVNGHSRLPDDPAFYFAHYKGPIAPQLFTNKIRSHVMHAIWHHMACLVLSPVYSFDARYFGEDVRCQAVNYVKEYATKKLTTEKHVLAEIEKLHADGGRLFLALLQKPGDMQLVQHSTYGANAPYLREVVASFKRHAGAEAVLVVKQHPLDDGRENLPAFFATLVKQNELDGRAFYLRKGRVDQLFARLCGAVTINSTMGLEVMQHGLPLIAMGQAIYDMPGLTDQGHLSAFWTAPAPPDPDVLHAFTSYLTNYSQVNGGFYSRQARRVLGAHIADALVGGQIAPHHAGSTLGRVWRKGRVPTVRVRLDDMEKEAVTAGEGA